MSTLLKKELIYKISATEDEYLLQLMKEEYDYFKGLASRILLMNFLRKIWKNLKIF